MYKALFAPSLLLILALLPALSGATTPGRQTLFNDDNYRPQGAHNSLPPPPPAAPRARPARPAAVQTVKVNWSWNSHSFSNQRNTRKPVSGVFWYQLANNRIDTSSVCDNYRAGSLIYRDCRKAARQHFKAQCSSQFPAACLAAGMTP